MLITCRRSGRTSTRVASTKAGTCCARRSSPARRSSASAPPDAALTERHDEIPAWDDMPDKMKPVLARQMEVYAGFWSTPTTTSVASSMLSKTSASSRTRSSTTSSRTTAPQPRHAQRTFNEMFMFNGAVALETPEFVASRIDEFGTPTPTAISPSAGRTRWTRPTSGRSRFVTGEGHATGRSCTGRAGSRLVARFGPTSTT